MIFLLAIASRHCFRRHTYFRHVSARLVMLLISFMHYYVAAALTMIPAPITSYATPAADA